MSAEPVPKWHPEDARPRMPETDPSSGKRPEAVPRNLPRRILAVICGAMLLAMMLLTVSDVLGRYILSHPVPGATEITELMLVAVIFLGLPAVSLDRDHVAVDVLTDRLPKRLDRWRELLMALPSAGVLGAVAWRIWAYAGQIASYGGATNTLRIPLAPLGYLCAICAGLAALFTLYAAFAAFRRG